MGTSKGYIPPKTIPWKNAKRAVTLFRNEPLSSERMHNAVAHFANARSGSDGGNRSVAKAIKGVSGLLGALKSGNVNSYLESIDRIDLMGKSSKEIFDILLYEYTNNGSSSLERILLYSIMKTVEALGIISDDDFASVSPEEFLIDFLAEFICNDFDRCFDEQMHKDILPAEYDATHDAIHGFIRNTVFEMRDDLKARTIDFSYLQDEALVRSIVNSAYRQFSDFLIEED